MCILDILEMQRFLEKCTEHFLLPNRKNCRSCCLEVLCRIHLQLQTSFYFPNSIQILSILTAYLKSTPLLFSYELALDIAFFRIKRITFFTVVHFYKRFFFFGINTNLKWVNYEYWASFFDVNCNTILYTRRCSGGELHPHVYVSTSM